VQFYNQEHRMIYNANEAKSLVRYMNLNAIEMTPADGEPC